MKARAAHKCAALQRGNQTTERGLSIAEMGEVRGIPEEADE